MRERRLSVEMNIEQHIGLNQLSTAVPEPPADAPSTSHAEGGSMDESARRLAHTTPCSRIGGRLAPLLAARTSPLKPTYAHPIPAVRPGHVRYRRLNPQSTAPRPSRR